MHELNRTKIPARLCGFFGVHNDRFSCTFMVAFYLPAGSPPPPSTIPDYPSPPPPSLEPASVTFSPPHLSPQAHSGNMVASCLDMLSHHPALYHLHCVCSTIQNQMLHTASNIHRISSPLSERDTSSIHLIIDTHFHSNFILHYLVQWLS